MFYKDLYNYKFCLTTFWKEINSKQSYTLSIELVYAELSF